jgi:hypothetical protein
MLQIYLLIYQLSSNITGSYNMAISRIYYWSVMNRYCAIHIIEYFSKINIILYFHPLFDL